MSWKKTEDVEEGSSSGKKWKRKDVEEGSSSGKKWKRKEEDEIKAECYDLSTMTYF